VTLVTMKIAALASNSFLTYIWYHTYIPVDHDFYGLESIDFFELMLQVVRTVTVLFITPVWPTVAPVQSACVKCVTPNFDSTNVASRNVVQVSGLYKV
jgi:hypothetical protein